MYRKCFIKLFDTKLSKNEEPCPVICPCIQLTPDTMMTLCLAKYTIDYNKMNTLLHDIARGNTRSWNTTESLLYTLHILQIILTNIVNKHIFLQNIIKRHVKINMKVDLDVCILERHMVYIRSYHIFFWISIRY